MQSSVLGTILIFLLVFPILVLLLLRSVLDQNVCIRILLDATDGTHFSRRHWFISICGGALVAFIADLVQLPESPVYHVRYPLPMINAIEDSRGV
jgi:hypothetical protein